MRFHDELNPVIWDKDNDNQMRPEVLAKLKEIANAFIEYIEIPEDAILDMVVTGSSASYNYNEFSDLDLHIIVDYDKIHEDCPLVEGYLGALKNTFNKEHDIYIHGVPVELYAEKKDQGTVHNGLYSVQNEEWIDRPEKIAPTDNDAAVEAKFNEIKEMVDKCDDSEAATELLEKIYAMRKAGLAEAGEFCTENLAFKKLRNEGCMDKLREIKKKDIDKQLSLESYTEDWSAEDINKYNEERISKVKQVLEEQFKKLGFNDVKWDGERQIYFFKYLDEPYYIVINTPGINGTGYDLYRANEYGIAKGRLLTYRDVLLNPEDVMPFVRAILSDIHKFILVNESMEEDYEEDDCEDIPEEMHKERYVTYFETQEGRQKYTIYHVYTDSTDDSYNELCDKRDNQLGMYSSYKELKDALKERAEKIAAKQGWTVKSIENLGEDDEYYRERNKWESMKEEKVDFRYGKDLEKGHTYTLSKAYTVGFDSKDFTEKELQKIMPYINKRTKGDSFVFDLNRDTKLTYKGRYRGYNSIKMEIENTGVILEMSFEDIFKEIINESVNEEYKAGDEIIIDGKTGVIDSTFRFAEDDSLLGVWVKFDKEVKYYTLEELKDKSKNEEKEMNEDNKFDYMMLDRLRQDCEYFLGNGNGSERNLWAGNVEDQIAEMRKIYDKLPEKPEWLSLEDIDKYEKDMLALKEQPMEEDLATLEKKMDNVDADIQDMINQLKDTTNEELITNLDTVIRKALDEEVISPGIDTHNFTIKVDGDTCYIKTQYSDEHTIEVEDDISKDDLEGEIEDYLDMEVMQFYAGENEDEITGTEIVGFKYNEETKEGEFEFNIFFEDIDEE